MQPSLLKIFQKYHKIQHLWIWLCVLMLRLISILPLPIIYMLSVIIGEVIFWIYRSRRKITLCNLLSCFPHQSKCYIRRVARGHFHSLIYAILSTGLTWWSSKKRMNRLTRYRNRDIYDESLQKNIILLAPHFAGLEYGGVFLSSERHYVSMYQTHQNPLIDELIKSHRSRFGAAQFSSNTHLSMKTIMKLIHRGYPFYYLPDQDPGKNKGIFAPFFSIPTATFSVLGRIAKLTNAVVIPCATRLLPWGRGYEIIFDNPIKDYPIGDPMMDTTVMNLAIERLIVCIPDQYIWSHKRFKTRPNGANYYK